MPPVINKPAIQTRTVGLPTWAELASIGQDIVRTFGQVGGYIAQHPLQTAEVAATSAGFVAAAVFTGGAAAPEEVAVGPAVIGGELATTGALTAAETGVGVGEAGGTLIPIAEAGAPAAAEAAGTGSTLGNAARSAWGFIRPVFQGVKQALPTVSKYGTIFGGAAVFSSLIPGIGANIAAGLDNLFSPLGLSTPGIPYPQGLGFPFGSIGGGTASYPAINPNAPQAKSGFTFTGLDLALLAVAAIAVVYVVSKR